MSKVKHTPGPWQIETDPFHYDTASTVVGGQRIRAKGISCQMLVQVGGWASPTEQEANTRLIAAAPELLDACQNAREMIATDRQAFVDRHRLRDSRTEDPIAHGLVAVGDGVWLDSSDAEALRDYDQSLALINAAIAKATGETPR